MKIWDLTTGTIRISRAAKNLRQQWDETRTFWTDQNSHDFEKNHLQPLAPQITLMLAAVHRLAEVLAQAERDCWDDDE